MGMNISNGGRKSRRAPMADINVTPFVDVMLVLLIIFMVTAPLLVAGVPVNLPESSAKPLEQQKEPIEVAVDEEGAIFIDGTQTADNQLATSFAAIAAQQEASGEDVQILLRADKSINYGRVVLVMGELNAAGLNQISLVTTTIETAGLSSDASLASSDTLSAAPISMAQNNVSAKQAADISVINGSSGQE